jgi:hypothetical protein
VTLPPRWSERLLRASLPADSMRDAIVGDLHQELVRDTVQVGEALARIRYRQRVAGIVAYVVLDIARWRAWGSTPIPVAGAAAATSRTPAVHRRGRFGRGDLGVFVAAFGLLGAGIVVNTLLFRASRHGQPADASALGFAALVLALGCAAGAAVLLCVGPRWLRRRACRESAGVPLHHP